MKIRHSIVVALFVVLSALTPNAFGQKGRQRPAGEAGAAFARAERKYSVDDREGARRELARTLELDPAYAPAYTFYRDTLNDDRDARIAEAEKFHKLAEANPTNPAYWYGFGVLSVDVDARQAAFEKVVQLAPKSPWGYSGLGLIGEIRNDPKAAMAGYEQAHKLAPNEPSIAHYLIGVYVKDPNHRNEAVKLLDSLLTSAPTSYFTEESLAAVADTATGDESLALARRYLKLFPQSRYSVWMHSTLVEDLASRDKPAAAARAKAVMATLAAPRYARGRGRLFDTFILQPAVESGKAAVDKLAADWLASKESSPYVFLSLAGQYADEKADRAVEVKLLERGYEAFLATKSTDEVGDDLRLGLGRARLRLDDPMHAVEYLSAIKSERLAPQVSGYLGSAYLKLGDSSQAYDAYIQAVAVAPSPESLQGLAAAVQAAKRTQAEADAAVWAIRDKAARPASEFTLAALDGGQVSLSDYRGKVVLLNFWFPG